VRVAARRLQLSGWVRNEKDGSVEIVASGAEDRLAELRKLVARGPDAAQVEQIIELDGVAADLEYPFAMKKSHG
jgi:acylphosphatase